MKGEIIGTQPLSDSEVNMLTTGFLLQEVGGTLNEEDGPMVMAEEESMEWYQIHQTMCLMPFHSLCSSHYYEPFSSQQPPVLPTSR